MNDSEITAFDADDDFYDEGNVVTVPGLTDAELEDPSYFEDLKKNISLRALQLVTRKVTLMLLNRREAAKGAVCCERPRKTLDYQHRQIDLINVLLRPVEPAVDSRRCPTSALWDN